MIIFLIFVFSVVEDLADFIENIQLDPDYEINKFSVHQLIELYNYLRVKYSSDGE
jgi:hypothetical protein